LFGGKPRQVMDLWRDGRLVLCVSDHIIAEYLEVLARFGMTKAEAQALLTMLTDQEKVVVVRPTVRVDEIAADPEDNRFLECALAARADSIVSGDSHLLGLKAFRGIPILAPAAFLSLVR